MSLTVVFTLRAVPEDIGRPSLYDRNPTRFWQVIALVLFVALLIAIAN